MDKFFKISERNSSVKSEVIGGITTFLTMAYIIVVNPAIISTTGMPFDGILFATVLVSAISCILMGLISNLPFALAPGMGINAFFTYSLVLGAGVEWQTALGAVFLSGIVFLILSVTKVRTLIVKAIPKDIRFAVAGGIGLFLALIGFKNAGFVVGSPATLVEFGGMGIITLLFVIGLVVTGFLMIKKIKGALLIGMVASSVITLIVSLIGVGAGWLENPLVTIPDSIVSLPSLEVFFKLDILGALSIGMIAPIFALLFTDMFDSISTFVGLSYASGLVDENDEPLNVDKAMLVDAISTTISGLAGTSAGTTYIESASGIEDGARTGLSAIVTGLLFLPFMFLAPLLSFIPNVATAPILVLVGVFMMASITSIDWKDFEVSIPCFLAMILIPFTFSITMGIVWGFLTYTIIKILRGKFREVSIVLYIVDVLALVGLFLGYL